MKNISKIKNLKTCFTLAEVLITLGIIGVFADMTMPNLLANVNGNKYRSQLKKTVSTIIQAVRLNQANYDWTFADVSEQCGGTNFQSHTSDTHMSICAILNSNLAGKQGIYRDRDLRQSLGYSFNGNAVGLSHADGQYTLYLLADGSIVGVRSISFQKSCSLAIGESLSEKLTSGDFHHCTGFIDVNGTSLPNQETMCSVGTTTKDINADCIVKSKDMKDVFPIVYHDAIVEPATNATRYVLQTTK
ncbi:type II secretion system protein [bacterium]|nr:type II secretion system protein [bacterium]